MRLLALSLGGGERDGDEPAAGQGYYTDSTLIGGEGGGGALLERAQIGREDGEGGVLTQTAHLSEKRPYSRVFVLAGAEEDHGLEGVPVLQHTLQGQLGEARRLQVMVRHVGV